MCTTFCSCLYLLIYKNKCLCTSFIQYIFPLVRLKNLLGLLFIAIKILSCMTLPFIIGEDSTNEAVFVDFEQLPHLFVSYSEESQIRQFICLLVNALQADHKGVPVDFALALSHSPVTHGHVFRKDCFFKYSFVADDELMSSVVSKEKFMQALSREMRERSILLKKQAEGKCEKRKEVPHMIILLHDVFDFIMSRKKSIGLIFLQLLLMGKALKMHVVAASGITYRMLLKQLVNLNPAAMKKYQHFFGNDQMNIVTPLGAELVITAEDFIFLKKANSIDYQRLYPLRNPVPSTISYAPRLTTTFPIVSPF
jgi:hypothetical protein